MPSSSMPARSSINTQKARHTTSPLVYLCHQSDRSITLDWHTTGPLLRGQAAQVRGHGECWPGAALTARAGHARCVGCSSRLAILCSGVVTNTIPGALLPKYALLEARGGADARSVSG